MLGETLDGAVGWEVTGCSGSWGAAPCCATAVPRDLGHHPPSWRPLWDLAESGDGVVPQRMRRSRVLPKSGEVSRLQMAFT